MDRQTMSKNPDLKKLCRQFGKLLRECRIDARHSRKQAARRFRMSVKGYRLIEKGRVKHVLQVSGIINHVFPLHILSGAATGWVDVNLLQLHNKALEIQQHTQNQFSRKVK